jgi:PAS domain S-box-containing protein
MMISDDQSNIILVNKEFLNVTGFSEEEIRDIASWKNLIAIHADLKKVADYEKRRSDNPETSPDSVELHIITKSGKIREILLTGARIPGTSEIVISFIDITERNHAQEIQRLANLINFVPDAVFAINTEGVVIAWNRTIEEMTGVLAKDMLGKGDYEYAIPFYGERRPLLIDISLLPDEEIEKKYQSLRHIGRILVAETLDARPKDRKTYLWGMATPLTDSKGTVIGAIESIRDITELKETERTLRVSQEKYSKLFHSSPDAIIISDLESGKIVEVNDTFSVHMGYSREEIMGKSAVDLGLWNTQETRDLFTDLLRKNGSVKGFETVTHSKSGEPFFVSISAEIISIEGKTLLISTIRDITERKQNEIALKESEEKYRNVVENAQDGIVIVQDLHLVFFNDACTNDRVHD